MLVQKVEPGLEVIETYTVDNDGNRKDFADGQYGVDPGAPEWYKRMQAERVKPFVESLNKDKAESAGVHDGDPKPRESSNGRELHICARAPGVRGNGVFRDRFRTVTHCITAPMSQSTFSKSTSTKQADIDDFSAAFKNNTKRFFL